MKVIEVDYNDNKIIITTSNKKIKSIRREIKKHSLIDIKKAYAVERFHALEFLDNENKKGSINKLNDDMMETFLYIELMKERITNIKIEFQEYKNYFDKRIKNNAINEIYKKFEQIKNNNDNDNYN